MTDTAKAMPFAKLGRVNAATRNNNAQNLVLICLLEMAAWAKGGVTMADLPNPERRWNRRSVQDWADMFQLHFDSAKRALRGLVERNLIEKHTLTRKSGEKVLLVRPTQRALAIWKGDGLGDEAHLAEGPSCPYAGGQSAPVEGDESPLSIEDSFPLPSPSLPLSNPASAMTGSKTGQNHNSTEAIAVIKPKGLDSLKALDGFKITEPVAYEAEGNAYGFTECFLKLAAVKEGSYAGTIKPNIKAVGMMKPVFAAAPKGLKLEFLAFVVDRWDALAQALKAAGHTGKDAVEAVTAAAKGGRYSTAFLVAHRTHLISQFLAHKAQEAKKSVMVEAPAPQLIAEAPPPPPKLNTFQKMKADAAAKKAAKESAT